MKIIIKEEEEEVINVNKINQNHIIVGFIDNNPVILAATYYMSGKYCFKILNKNFTKGNSYTKGFGINVGYNSISDAIKTYDNGIFEAFTNWREALQWLLDNDNLTD